MSAFAGMQTCNIRLAIPRAFNHAEKSLLVHCHINCRWELYYCIVLLRPKIGICIIIMTVMMILHGIATLAPIHLIHYWVWAIPMCGQTVTVTLMYSHNVSLDIYCMHNLLTMPELQKCKLITNMDILTCLLHCTAVLMSIVCI